jgi:hypothetical protein
MDAMSKRNQAAQQIQIQWTAEPTDERCDTSRPSSAQIKALAIALGQLAARMERARAMRTKATCAMISAAGTGRKEAAS